MRMFLSAVHFTPQLVDRWGLPPFFRPCCVSQGDVSLQNMVPYPWPRPMIHRRLIDGALRARVWMDILAAMDDEAALLPLCYDLGLRCQTGSSTSAIVSTP